MPAEVLTLFDVPTRESATRTRRRTAPDPLDALPPTVDLVTAAALLGIGRTCAYRLVSRGEWPTPVIRAGRCIRIPTAPLVALLRSGGGFPQTDSRPARGR